MNKTRFAFQLILGILLGLLLTCLGCLLSSAAGGMIYQGWGEAQDRTRYPPPGRLVDVGGYQLHIHCMGTGSPTIILDAGHTAASLDWIKVQPALSTTTRICSVDRAGNGWSDPGPAPRTSSRIAGELHTLLHNADIPGPYILVGHSMGGLHMRLYATLYPDEVAGLVLIDSTQEKLDQTLPPEIHTAQQTNKEFYIQMFQVLEQLSRVGLIRLLVTTQDQSWLTFLDDFPPEIHQTYLSTTLLRTSFYTAAWQELDSMEEDYAEINAAGPLPDVPMIVIARGLPDSNFESQEWIDTGEQIWRRLQTELAESMPQGKLIIAEESGHVIPFEQPQVIIEALREVVQQARQEP